MLARRNGGFIEFIPTPAEKRDGVLRDHALALMRNLHERMRRLETAAGMDPALGDAFDEMADGIAREEAEARRIHANII